MAKVERDTACMVIGLFWLAVAIGALAAGNAIGIATGVICSQVCFVESWR